jgi:hypothetical protein
MLRTLFRNSISLGVLIIIGTIWMIKNAIYILIVKVIVSQDNYLHNRD